jgi:hypothetical protein
MQSSYLTLEADPSTGSRHPILAGLEDAERIINGDSRVVTKQQKTYLPLTLIPYLLNKPRRSDRFP